jgi:hypothetical protein
MRIQPAPAAALSSPVMFSLARLLRRPHLLATAVALACLVPAALAQQNWRWAHTLPASVSWNDVAHGNGLYVAVGSGGTIASSPDGLVWTVRRMTDSFSVLNGVAFAEGRFVAVGMGAVTRVGAALILTSPDGITWTANDSLAATVAAQLTDVTYGAGTWVVTGFGGTRLLTSPDAATWTSRTVPGIGSPSRVVFGGGRFVANAGNHTGFTSTDGITWTSVTVAPANSFLGAVAFSAGKFLLVGRDNNFNASAYTSTDGTTWTSAGAISGTSGSVGFTAAAGSATGFVAAGGNLLYTSPDGLVWTARTSALPLAPRQLDNNRENVATAAFANNQFFVTGIYGSITTSPDGTAWTRRSLGTVAQLGSVLHDGNRYIVSGSGGTILTSPDAIAWTQLVTGSTADFQHLATNGTRFVVAGFNGIFQSTNLTAWTAVTGTNFDRWTAAAYGGGRFVVANSATTLGVRHSTDGVTWSAAVGIPGAGGNTNGLLHGNGLFVLTMSGFGTTPSKIYTSTDATVWTQRAATLLTTTTQLRSLAFGNGRFVALTGNQQALVSTDGLEWRLVPLSSSVSLTTIRFLGNRFYASGAATGIPAETYASSDGETWSPLAGTAGQELFGNDGATSSSRLVAVGNTVVAVGHQGTILRGELPAAPAASNSGRLVNLSIRTVARTGDDTLIVGVGLGGTAAPATKAVLLRAIGPSLGAFGVGGTLADTVLTVFQGQTQVAQNDDWAGGFDFASVGAFALAGNPIRDAALYNAAIPSGSYSIQVTGKNNATGVALAEIYDATPASSFSVATPRLINVSARTQVGTGDDVLIAGFSIGGSTPLRVLIRAVGPTLAAFGVGGTLADPRLQIFRGQTQIAENDNWAAADAATFGSVGAFALQANSRDAALVITLQPGTYSAQISGVNNTTGVALVEVYELP